MNVAAWVLIGYFIAGALTTILLIGRDRKPVTPSVAVGVVIADALLCWAVVLAVEP